MSDDKLPSWMVEDSPSPSPAPTAVSTPSHSPAPVPALNYSNPSPPKAAPADDTPDWMKTESDAPSNPTSTDLYQKQHQRPSPQQDQQSQFLEEGNRRDYQHSETPPDWMMSDPPSASEPASDSGAAGGKLKEPLLSSNNSEPSEGFCSKLVRCFQSFLMLILLAVLVGVAFILFVFSFIQTCPTDSTYTARLIGCAFFGCAAMAMLLDYIQNNSTPISSNSDDDDSISSSKKKKKRKAKKGKGRLRYKGCGCGKCLWQLMSTAAVIFFLVVMVSDSWAVGMHGAKCKDTKSIEPSFIPVGDFLLAAFWALMFHSLRSRTTED